MQQPVIACCSRRFNPAGNFNILCYDIDFNLVSPPTRKCTTLPFSFRLTKTVFSFLISDARVVRLTQLILLDSITLINTVNSVNHKRQTTEESGFDSRRAKHFLSSQASRPALAPSFQFTAHRQQFFRE